MEKIVVKIGTAAITDTAGAIDEKILHEIGRQICALRKNFCVAIVSSGAVGAGKKFLGKNFRGKILEKKCAAAIGNPILIRKYVKFFADKKIRVAQVLCEREHFSDREKFLSLRGVFDEFWKNGILPIVNENDVISSDELEFSDNDELATLLAIGLRAKKLFFGTSVAGVFCDKKIIPKIENFDEKIFALAEKKISAGGRGGMASKLHFAKIATNFGIDTFIFDARQKSAILDAEKFAGGTFCPAKICNLDARKKWLASGAVRSGKIFVDAGAAAAIKNRKSLLAVGIKKIAENFLAGEIVEIFAEKKIGICRAKISAEKFLKLKNKKNVEFSHADEILIFEN